MSAIRDLDSLQSGLYQGTVSHTRIEPKRHQFQYRVFMSYIDLAELETFFGLSPFWSSEHFNLAWFRRADYLDPQIPSLDTAVRRCVQEATGENILGPIRVLTNLRMWAFLINPISCYYCFDEEDRLRYIVAEVTSTPWRERIPYVIPCSEQGLIHEHKFDKQMHVSPFMPMNMQYSWRSNTPDKEINIQLQNWAEGQLSFHASVRLQRINADSASLNRMLLSYPFMTLKVGLAIYWQALRLFLKRIPLVKHSKISKSQPTKGNPNP